MRINTIRSSDHIGRVLNRGKRQRGHSVTLYVAPRECSGTDDPHRCAGRVAFLAGKRLGGAVWRNRAKRVMREAYRMAVSPEQPDVLQEYDIMMVANKYTSNAGAQKVSEEFCELRDTAIARLRKSVGDKRG